jgi:putative nucleotidyltransferase with HDIG domain
MDRSDRSESSRAASDLARGIERRRLQLQALSYFIIVSLAVMLVLSLFSLSSIVPGLPEGILPDLGWVWQTYLFRVLFLGFVLAVVLYMATKEREQRTRNEALTAELVEARIALEQDVNRMGFAAQLSDILANVRDAESQSAAVEQALDKALSFYGGAGGAVVRPTPGAEHSAEAVVTVRPGTPVDAATAETVAVRIAMRVAQAGGPFLNAGGGDEDTLYMTETGITSALGIPLRVGTRLHSVLCLWTDLTDLTDRVFGSSDVSAFRILAHQLELALARAEVLTEKDAILRGVMRTLTMVVESRDRTQVGHGENVGRLAEAMGREMELEPAQLCSLRIAGLLHDIGLVSMPEGILGEDVERMSDGHRRVFEQHPLWGAQVLSQVLFPDEVTAAVRTHHERYDGSGYPHRLKAKEIPLAGRILAVADAFEAATSHSRNRVACAPEDALALIQAQMGTAFDPAAVQALEAVAKESIVGSIGEQTVAATMRTA